MTKTVKDNVPIELYKLKERIYTNMKLKKKKDAYLMIEQITKPILFFENKRGQLFDIITFSVLIFVVIISLGIMLFVNNAFNTVYQQTETDATLRSNLETYNQSTTNWWDFSFALLFFLFLIALIAIMFFLGTMPLWIIFQFVFLIILGVIFVALHNIANTIVAAFPTVLNANNTPLLYFIVDKYYYIIMVFYLFALLSLFVKPKSASSPEGI